MIRFVPRSFVRKGLALPLGMLAAFLVAASPVAAQTAAPVATSGGLNTASLGRMRLSFSLVPAPLGTFESNLFGLDTSGDTAFAFGLRPAFDYSINDYFFVGLGPQYFFNVKREDQSSSGKELDLLLRVGGHAPVADNIHLYGYLAPGYSVIYLPNTEENASGFALGVGAGAIYSLPGNLYAVADLGYQIGFQQVTVLNTTVDAKVNFLLVGLGLGIKL